MQKIEDIFVSEKLLHLSHSNTSNRAKNNWEVVFKQNRRNHARQNEIISKDFLLNVRKQPAFQEVISHANSILEFGCGSGELLNRISNKFPNVTYCLGIDISEIAISNANDKYKRNGLEYRYYDALQENGFENIGKFDLIICSNTLEHFKKPHDIIQLMLKNGVPHLIFLVPYLQPCTDGYDCEGGMGHVYTFDDLTFTRYNVISKFTFTTKGWRYSSKGEVPTQLAVLIGNKYCRVQQIMSDLLT
jgi:SAM-dependent methyltransferase